MSRAAMRAGQSKRIGKPQGASEPAAPVLPVTRIIDEASLSAALDALHEADPHAVGPMLALAGPPPLRRRSGGFDGLAWIIVSQQVSTASARAIFSRVEATLAPLTGQTVLAASDETLRACGLSAPKMRTLRALADAVAQGALPLDDLTTMAPHEAHGALTAVHGVGPWTADIYLLFCAGHPDVWPAGDLALQEGARLALGLRKRPDARALEKLSQRWRPWRAVAARLIWAYYGARLDAMRAETAARPRQQPTRKTAAAKTVAKDSAAGRSRAKSPPARKNAAKRLKAPSGGGKPTR